MPLHEITPDNRPDDVGVVYFRERGPNRPISKILVSSMPVERDILISFLMSGAIGRVSETNSLLSPRAACELAAGVLATVRLDYACTNEQLVNYCQQVVAEDERQRKGIQAAVADRQK